MDIVYAALIPSAVTVIGALLIFFRWVGRVDELVNTTQQLNSIVDRLRGDLLGELVNLKVRVAVLEDRAHIEIQTQSAVIKT
jgi:hypothetical protein